MNENELMHYGVPGMKWGVRRDRDNGSTLTSAEKNKEYKKSLRTDKKIRRNLESKAYDSARFANAYSKKSKSYSKKYENSDDWFWKRYGVSEEETYIINSIIENNESILDNLN